MVHTEFIVMCIKERKIGDPIYTADLTEQFAAEYDMEKKQAGAAVSVAMKRVLEQELCPQLRFYQKGIYYLTNKTPFGETGINKEKLIQRKYLLPDMGYETGYAAMYHLGLTTQIPGERVFATNRAKDCQRTDKALGVCVRPPRVEITARNKRYLQLLDVMELMEKAPVDNPDPYGLLADFLRKHELQYGTLLAIAEQHYPKNTIFQIARTAAAQGGAV